MHISEINRADKVVIPTYAPIAIRFEPCLLLGQTKTHLQKVKRAQIRQNTNKASLFACVKLVMASFIDFQLSTYKNNEFTNPKQPFGGYNSNVFFSKLPRP